VNTGPDPIPLPVPHRVTWGLGDFFWIYVAGLAGGIVLGSIGVAIANDKPGETSALTFALSALGLYAAWFAGLIYVSRRKGRGSLYEDFGLTARASMAWGLIVGVLLQFLLSALVLPLVNLANNESQEVVNDLKNASGAKLIVILVVAGLLAPVAEETLFRGLLLRSLRRRFSVEVAIVISALVFAAAHLLGDASLGVVAIFPALAVLGVVNGIAAVWTGDLSLSIPIHMGFNLVTLALNASLHH
jgi:membrane protease YdiL (CAAX protease family)